MAMEAAVDIDSGADFNIHSCSHSHSDVRSQSNSAYSRVTGVTGVDVESGEDARLVGGRGHRSMYAALAEEALLGTATPCDPEGAFEQAFSASQPIEIVPSEFQDANGSSWRMGSAGAFWRLDSAPANAPPPGMPARCCVTSPDDSARTRARAKGLWWVPIAGCIGALLLVVVCWDVRSWVLTQQAAGNLLLAGPQGFAPRGCCTAAAAPCFACRAGLSVQEFCASKGRDRGVLGCEDHDCCQRKSAECLACSSGLSLEQYCAAPSHVNVTGCGDDKCGLIEEGLEYPGGDLYSVGSVTSADACCSLCRGERKCTSWSWGGTASDSIFKNRCFLKRQAELKARAASGYISGVPGMDAAEFHVKSRFGICLGAGVGKVDLQDCSPHADVQHWVFERRLGRLSTADGLCLEAAAHSGDLVTVAPCEDDRASQRWHYSSESGHLRTGKKLCMHAPDRKERGSKVQMRPCSDSALDQEWNLWSSELLGRRSTVEAMHQAEIVPTTTTVTTTRAAVTTTTMTKLPSLFCFSVMVSWGYEPGLVRMQADERRSIFACDGSAVYSNAEMDFGSVTSRIVRGTDLHCEKGGPFNTLLNTPVFKKVWEQVLADGLYKPYDWIVKADCDTVFFPARLRTMIRGPALQNAQDGGGLFLNNCGFGLHGPLEVVSRTALETYKAGFQQCEEPPQEDVFLQACMMKLGVKQVNQFTLLAEDHCRTANWQACQSEHVSFHPFKDAAAYRACGERAAEADDKQITA